MMDSWSDGLESMGMEDWATALCTLLDRIEMVAGDEVAVRKLCRSRFAIARAHGFTVEFGEPASGSVN